MTSVSNSTTSTVELPVPSKLLSKSEPEVAPGKVESSSTLGLKSTTSLNSYFTPEVTEV